MENKIEDIENGDNDKKILKEQLKQELKTVEKENENDEISEI